MDTVIEKIEVEKKLIHVDDVAKLIGKASTTIRTFSTKNGCKHLIPRPFKMPNSRRLCWYEHEVIEWIESKKISTMVQQEHN